jgi:hypothetical protein
VRSLLVGLLTFKDYIFSGIYVTFLDGNNEVFLALHPLNLPQKDRLD